MRPNGFVIVIDMALRELQHPLLNRYRNALILGAFRENVYYMPGLGTVSLNPSISHFYHPQLPGGIIPFVWPGPRMMANVHFSKAVRACNQGNFGGGFVQLGRVSHLLTDMACPVHAQSVFHSTDPFEWCVEAMGEDLRKLPVPEIPEYSHASEFVEQLAQHTQRYAAEKTNNPWGYVLKKIGMRSNLNTEIVRRQAIELIPLAAGYMASLYRFFIKSLDHKNVSAEGPPMKEILAGLEMPAKGLLKWFGQLEQFCKKHGGTNHYSEILELVKEARDTR